jgi:hypothetical protein
MSHSLPLTPPDRLEKELRKQTKQLVEIRMSYPLPLSKGKRHKPNRYAAASLDLTLVSSAPHSNDLFTDERASAHVTFSSSPALSDDLPHLNSLNNCDKLVELINSVLGSSSEDNQTTTPMTRNTSDVHIYVRRKGDFQVRRQRKNLS